MSRTNGRVAQLLQIIDQAYNRKSWHGTNLRGSLRGVTADEVEWRPAPARHNIHELVVHAAYWKYAVANRLSRGPKGAFAVKGSNWFSRASTTDRQWRDDVALLERTHKALRATIDGLTDRDLDRSLPGSDMTPFALVAGVAAHDLYHAGQIQLIKVLRRSA